LAILRAALFEAFGLTDTTIGIDFAGRTEPWTEALIGFFARQLPLRLRGAPVAFGQAMRELGAGVAGALGHAELSFTEIAAVAPAGELFAVKFSLEQDMAEAIRLDGLTVEPVAIAIAGAKFPLLLNASLLNTGLAGGVLRCRAEFMPARVPRDRVERLLAGWRRAAEAVIGGGGARFARRPVGSGGLTAWADPEVPRPIVTLRASGSRDLGDHAAQVRAALAGAGAVLVRGLPETTAEAFAADAERLIGTLLDYNERSSPRTALGHRIHTSTEYPASLPIPLHHENSYAARWPRWIAFLCVAPAVSGGRTPIADGRAVLAALPATIRDTFERRGVRYVRRFGGALGLSARAAFGAEGSALDAALAEAGYRVARDCDGGLVTQRDGPALRTHPDTGEAVWFNHAHFFHPAAVAPDGLPEAATRALPYDVRYGDGGVIDASTIAAIGAVYRRVSIAFSWRAGDLLLLDNMLFAHGREAFTGARRVWTAQGTVHRDGE
jgi:alpha-ketoglutarate-dependent taurine dioxygenase